MFTVVKAVEVYIRDGGKRNDTSGSRGIQSIRCLLQWQQMLRVTRDWGEKIPLSGKKYLGSVSLKLYIQH